jgi:hypothetical protein
MELGGVDFRIRFGCVHPAPGHEDEGRSITKLDEVELGYIHRGPEIDKTVSPAGWNANFFGHTIFFLAARCRQASSKRFARGYYP